MAWLAATSDPRFNPVEPAELTQITIEISALTPRLEIRDPEEIIIGTHGLCVSLGSSHGVLLPQVATEHGLDRDEFLAHTCMKAGLPADAWRSEKIKIEVFTAEVFGENDFKKEKI
jgi:AmmeMemoRadiSam system protein A